MAREKDLTSGIVARLLLRINILELHEHILIVLEAILLQIERHQDAIDVENEIFGIHTIKDIIGDGKGYLALHSMRLAQLTYLIYFVTSNHSTFNI